MNFIPSQVIPAFRMILSAGTTKVLKFISNEDVLLAINSGVLDDAGFYLVLENSTSEMLISDFQKKYAQFKEQNQFDPKIIIIKNGGVIAVGETAKETDALIHSFTQLLNGEGYLSANESYTIENPHPIYQKIAIVTGGAQGFGGGIVDKLFEDGANVVIADLNEEVGMQKQNELNARSTENRAFFIKTNVAEEVSVQNLISQTVAQFGGLDLFISNAGVLRAGGLDEMTLDTFNFMTSVNYSAFFVCSKFASEVMKLQNNYNKDYFSDIIQINSKSGLRGSNKNFAYAGGKFGGIGLTQSFALELMPYKIKVNSICPGNFFEGPLWSDPEKGLFVQYLKAGKVPGAKTIEDVKMFYEKQVPAGRGCMVKDVMRAVYYVVEQEYETGQAIPVTGGQVMLN